MKTSLYLLVVIFALIRPSTANAADNKTWTGSVNNDWYVPGNWSPPGVPATNDTINISSGSPNATPPVTITGTLNWMGGTISGGLTVASGGVLNLSGPADKQLAGVLNNAGHVIWGGSGNLLGQYCCSTMNVISNQAGALFEVQTDAALSTFSCCGPAYFDVYNAGTFRKSASSGGNVLSWLFHNTGTVEIQSGTINLQGGYLGDASANLAISLGGTTFGVDYGQISFPGSLTLNGSFTVSARNGFRPSPGDTFAIVLRYPAATNDFACYQGLDLGGGLWLQPYLRRTGLALTATAYPTNGLPSLFATRSPGGVRIFWTLGFPNWELVSSTNLFPPVWTPVPATNCDNQVILPVTTPEQYFQLKKTD